MLVNTLGLLLATGALVLVLMALVAPVESLRWWAGWSGQESAEPTQATFARPPAADLAERYVVWLSGVGSISGDFVKPCQQRFLDELAARLPTAKLVSDAFAYSVRNNPLTGHRALAWLWRYIERRERKNPDDRLGALVELHNALKVAVSADARYGPIFNLGLARSITERLLAHGYAVERPRPITLIGYSGGGQIAAGAAPFLHAWLATPIQVIAIGGVVAPDRRLAAIEHVYLVQGSNDPIPRLATIVFPGRWPLLRRSFWNRALATGKLTVLPVGPTSHRGRPGGRFDRAGTCPFGQRGPWAEGVGTTRPPRLPIGRCARAAIAPC